MNKLYTLLIVLFLAGCSPQGQAFNSSTTAFRSGCVQNTVETNFTSSGDTITLTATCTKAK